MHIVLTPGGFTPPLGPEAYHLVFYFLRPERFMRSHNPPVLKLSWYRWITGRNNSDFISMKMTERRFSV